MCDTLLGIFLQPYWFFAITNLTAYVLERLFTRGIPWTLGYKIKVDRNDLNPPLNKKSSFNSLQQDGTLDNSVVVADESGQKGGVYAATAGVDQTSVSTNNLNQIGESVGAMQLQSIINNLTPLFMRDFLQNLRNERSIFALKQSFQQQEEKINQMRSSGVESGLLQEQEDNLSRVQIEMERLQEEISNYRQSRQTSKVIDSFRESLLTTPSDPEVPEMIPEIVQQFQDAYNGLQVIIALTMLLSAAVSSSRYSDSPWTNYQRMILVLNNSMVLAFWLSSFESSSRVPFMLCSMFLLPGIITHVLPGLFMYIWLLPLTFLFSIFAIWMAFSLLSVMLRPCLGDAAALRINTMLAANVIARSLFPLLLVVATDYAVLLYTGSGYAGVIEDDVRLRHQPRCYFDGMFGNLDQLLVMLNWI